MALADNHTWELWYPGAGATGIPIARARIDPAEVVWAHSMPRKVSVTVRQGDDRVVARGEGLARSGGYLPMTRFTLDGVQQRARRIEIERVSELVRLRGPGGLDARCLLASIVAAEAALAE